MKQLILYLLLFCSWAMVAQEQKYILLDSLTAKYTVKQYTLDTSPYGVKNSIEVYNVFSDWYGLNKNQDYIVLFSVLPDIDSQSNWEEIDYETVKAHLFPTKDVFKRIIYKTFGFFIDKSSHIDKLKLVKKVKDVYYVSKYCWIEDFYCIDNPFGVPIPTKEFIINIHQPITPIGVLRDTFMKLYPFCDRFPFEENTDNRCGIDFFLKNTYLSNIEEKRGDIVYHFYQFDNDLYTNISRFAYIKDKGIVGGVYFNYFITGPWFIDETGNWRKLKRLPENEILWAEELKKEWGVSQTGKENIKR